MIIFFLYPWIFLFVYRIDYEFDISHLLETFVWDSFIHLRYIFILKSLYLFYHFHRLCQDKSSIYETLVIGLSKNIKKKKPWYHLFDNVYYYRCLKEKQSFRGLLIHSIYYFRMTSLPIIENVTLSFANISNDIYPLIHSIRPDWMSSNTRLVTFTEGLTNIILGLFDNRTPDDDSKTLIIKIYGSQTELFIDRQSEINAMNLFSRENVFSQRVLIQFNNGIIYEYASGRTCSRDDVQNENISRLIAIKLAQFHNVPIEKPAKPYIISLSRKFLELLHESSFDLSSIKSDLSKNISFHVLFQMRNSVKILFYVIMIYSLKTSFTMKKIKQSLLLISNIHMSIMLYLISQIILLNMPMLII